MRIRNKNQGFTLIEVAIAITIIGLIAAGFARAYVIFERQRDTLKEEQTFDTVQAALANYLRVNGAYPCPADPTLGPAAGLFGHADPNPGTCSGIPGTPEVAYGAVPTFDLNLPYYEMLDVNKYKLTYVVTRASTQDTSYQVNGGEIIINIVGGGTLTENPVHYAVISHGPDAKGAWPLGGGAQVPCPPASLADDRENCDTNDNIIAFGGKADLSDPNQAGFYYDTLAFSETRKETTMWMIDQGMNAAAPGAGAGGFDVINRNTNNVGIGLGVLNPPQAKLHVSGGDVVVEQFDPGTGTPVGGRVEAEAEVRSPRFNYTGP